MKKILLTIGFILVLVQAAYAESAYSSGYYKNNPKEAAKAFTEASIMAVVCFKGKADFRRLHDVRDASGYASWHGRENYIQTVEETTYNQLDDVYSGRVDKEKFCQTALRLYGSFGEKIPSVLGSQ